VTKAKKSIAAFNCARHEHRREGHASGRAHVRVLDKLFNIVLPRIRDFRGLRPSRSTGAALQSGPARAAGLPGDQYDKVDKTRGMDITIVTTARLTRSRGVSFGYGAPDPKGNLGELRTESKG